MTAPSKEAYERANAIQATMPPNQRKATAAAIQALLDEREVLRANVPDSEGFRKARERAENAERDLAADRETLRLSRDALRESKAKLTELIRAVRELEREPRSGGPNFSPIMTMCDEFEVEP